MDRIGILTILCAMTFAIGCQPTEISSVGGYENGEAFGYFNGDVVATWNGDGRRMTLVNDFEYVDVNDRHWVAPAGSIVDGASIPSAFWTFIGGPFEGKYRYASVVHDVECERMTSSWEDVHRMFYEAMRSSGVSDSQAKTMYYAVYHFGPRWEPVESSQPLASASDEQGILPVEQTEYVARARSGRRMRRYQPAPPTQEELEQLQDFIQEDNPNTATIERTSRDALHRRPRRQRDSDPYQPRRRESQSTMDDYAASNSDRSRQRSRGNSTRDSFSDQGRRSQGTVAESETRVVDQREQQWVIGKVEHHFANGSNQQIPATYEIHQSSDEYRVRMKVHSQTSRGEATGYQEEQLVVRVSKAGEVLEVLR